MNVLNQVVSTALCLSTMKLAPLCSMKFTSRIVGPPPCSLSCSDGLCHLRQFQDNLHTLGHVGAEIFTVFLRFHLPNTSHGADAAGEPPSSPRPLHLAHGLAF